MFGFTLPISIRAKSSDLLAFHQVFTFNGYDINLGFNPKIIDAGANIGFASIYFSKKYSDAKVTAIEPEKSNFELLKINSINFQNIVLYKIALSNEQNLNLNVIDKGYGNWGFTRGIYDKMNFLNVVDTVKTITIDELLKENDLESIDLLKIDIEGAEKNFLKVIMKIGS